MDISKVVAMVLKSVNKTKALAIIAKLEAVIAAAKAALDQD